MNRKIEFKEDKVIVTDDNGYEKERALSSNIKEILTSENDIEKMEEMICEEQDYIKSKKKEMFSASNHKFLLGTLWLINILLRIGTPSDIITVCLFGTSSVLYFSLGAFEIASKKKYIKISKKKIDFIKEKLNEEKNNLNNLQNNSDDASNYIDTSTCMITNSKKIDKLKNQLYLIYDYLSSKKKYIKYFNSGILKEMLYNYYEDEINFLSELIKNDISSDNEIEKQKKLTK